MAFKKQKRNSLLRVSNEKKLRLIRIVMECRDLYGKCLEFLERHPDGATEETLQELEYQLIVWYKDGSIKPFVMVTTSRYVIAKLRSDFRKYWRKKGKHPNEIYRRGYETAWTHFKVPKSNVVVDPHRRLMYITGVGHLEYNRPIFDLEKATAVKVYVADNTPYMLWEYLRD